MSKVGRAAHASAASYCTAQGAAAAAEACGAFAEWSVDQIEGALTAIDRGYRAQRDEIAKQERAYADVAEAQHALDVATTRAVATIREAVIATGRSMTEDQAVGALLPYLEIYRTPSTTVTAYGFPPLDHYAPSQAIEILSRHADGQHYVDDLKMRKQINLMRAYSEHIALAVRKALIDQTAGYSGPSIVLTKFRPKPKPATTAVAVTTIVAIAGLLSRLVRR